MMGESVVSTFALRVIGSSGGISVRAKPGVVESGAVVTVVGIVVEVVVVVVVIGVDSVEQPASASVKAMRGGRDRRIIPEVEPFAECRYGHDRSRGS
jgi:hypothetical protein